MKRHSLKEIVHSESLKIDKELGVIKGVKVLGRESKNGRTYSDGAMADAAKLYEGVKVNIDHPQGREGSAERGFAEGIGELRNITRDRDGVFGDLHFLKTHPSTPMLVESAERFPRQFGLSHNAEGDLNERDGKWVVESIQAVHSVDIVSRPATNAGIFESVDETGKDAKVKTTVRKLVESKGSAKQKARLAEMAGGDAAVMDAAAEVPDSGSSDDQVAAAFESMVMAVLRDSSMDLKGKVGRIKDILTTQDKLLNGGAAQASEGGSGDGPAKTNESLEAKVRRLENESRARELLEEHDVAATPARVKILSLMEGDEDRKSAIGEWPKRGVASGGRDVAKPGRSEPIQESTLPAEAVAGSLKDVDSFVRATR